MEKKLKLKPIFHKIATIISWFAFGILVVVGLFLLYYIISIKLYETKGEKYEPVFALYTIISPSMEPKLNVYDVIVNSKVDEPSDVQVGDIITFTSTSSISKGMTVTHRVVEKYEENGEYKFRTKGDNNESVDSGIVNFENIIGKTMFKIPLLGRVQFLLASPGGWIFLVVIPALGIIIYDILKVFKVIGRKKKIVEPKKLSPKDEIEKESLDEEFEAELPIKKELPEETDVEEAKDFDIEDILDQKEQEEVELPKVSEEIEEVELPKLTEKEDSDDKMEQALDMLEEVNKKIENLKNKK